MGIVEFLKARLDEDEQAARDVPPLGHNYDMGGKRQDERFTFGRSLPSSADGMGNWSEHSRSPTTRAHFARHDPARVLREVEAKRQIVELADEATGLDMQVDLERLVGSRDMSEEPYIGDQILRALALAYADHPDYEETLSA